MRQRLLKIHRDSRCSSIGIEAPSASWPCAVSTYSAQDFILLSVKLPSSHPHAPMAHFLARRSTYFNFVPQESHRGPKCMACRRHVLFASPGVQIACYNISSSQRFSSDLIAVIRCHVLDPLARRLYSANLNPSCVSSSIPWYHH